jgi:hypothetical protein
VNIPTVWDVIIAALFSSAPEPEADQATLGPCERGPEPEPEAGI